MASGVTKVILRCEDAMENEHLDLSDCQLMQVPDAIYFLMRNSIVKIVDLSSNVLTKIPAKLPSKFTAITALNLSHNRIGVLPQELKDLKELTTLNISHNALVSLPNTVFAIPKLEHLDAQKNFIADVDLKPILKHDNLKTVNLQENPLSSETHNQLSSINSIKILVSPIVQEEWEIIPET